MKVQVEKSLLGGSWRTEHHRNWTGASPLVTARYPPEFSWNDTRNDDVKVSPEVSRMEKLDLTNGYTWSVSIPGFFQIRSHISNLTSIILSNEVDEVD